MDNIEELLKEGPEQKLVVGPIVKMLLDKGWGPDQIMFGHHEWGIPKNPSEASKREIGHSFDHYPVDIAVFDKPTNVGDYRHIVFIVECKQPSIDAGVQQLETYLGLEPHVRLGIWSNTSDPTAEILFVYRSTDGLDYPQRKTLKDLPSPGDKLDPRDVKLKFKDLIVPSVGTLKKTFETLLDIVVARDSNVTRAEDQLDQLCNIILLKLDSDKKGVMDEDKAVYFRPYSDTKTTASNIRKMFDQFRSVYPDIFITSSDKELRFNDETISYVVDSLYSLNMLDVGPDAVSTAFQVLRRAALKQEEGQYFTPKPVIEAAVRFMDISMDDIILDPACGTGGFLIECLTEMKRRYPKKNKEVSKWAQLHLFGIDKDAIGIKLTKAVMQILDDGSANCVRGNSVSKHRWHEEYPHLTSNNFTDGRFTKIFTNPPFGKDVKISISEAKKAGLDIVNYQKKSNDFELGIAMFNRCYDFLADGGKLCIVLPETYFFSPSYKYIREWLKGRFKPIMAINIPMEAFQGYCRAKTNLYIFEKITTDYVYGPEVEVLFINPKTCGINKSGDVRYKVDSNGNMTDVIDNELGISADEHIRHVMPRTIPIFSEKLESVMERDVLVPQYYDYSYDDNFNLLVKKRGLDSITVGELIDKGIIQMNKGHASPSKEQRKGTIPYIKVSDIRNLRVNINPTNMIPVELARQYWKSEKSGLKAWDLISPNRASSNIGEFAILIPGEEDVVLTKEMYVIRVNENEIGMDVFYLLWALSLSAVRNQWRRITLMQTNREDVGLRYREIMIPISSDKNFMMDVSQPFRSYFTSIAESKNQFINSLRNDGFDYIGSIVSKKQP